MATQSSIELGELQDHQSLAHRYFWPVHSHNLFPEMSVQTHIVCYLLYICA